MLGNADWTAARLRFRARVNPKATVDLEPSAQVSFVPMEAVGDDGSLNLDRTRPVSEVSQGYTYFENGDVSIAKITPCFENGKGAVMDGLVGRVGFGTTELIVLRPEEEISPRFLYYVTQSDHFRGPGEAAMLGSGGQKRVPDLFVKDFETAWPSKDLQNAIVHYLDTETARIDGLIEQKEKLKSLLVEMRTATISEAVLGRIHLSHPGKASPQSSLKPSGLNWMGDVPTHWSVCALTYRYAVQLGKMLDAKRITGNHLAPYLRNTDVQWLGINTEDLPEMDFDSEDRTKYSLEPGDVLVCEGGEVGRAAVWNLNRECYYQKALHRLRPHGEQDEPRFMVYVLRCAVDRGAFATAEKSTIAHLPADALRQHRFAFPPLSEQKSIVRYLDAETTRIDSLVRHVDEEIALLQELRSATITDAVLGRIDVRAHMKN